MLMIFSQKLLLNNLRWTKAHKNLLQIKTNLYLTTPEQLINQLSCQINCIKNTTLMFMIHQRNKPLTQIVVIKKKIQ